MDLWNPTLNEDGTWLLGSGSDYYEITDAYSGSITDDGKIEGCVPQYIYNDTLKKFTPVTKMRSTFYGNYDLIVAPEIPNTVTDMFACFTHCENLEEAPELPENLTNMNFTFYECRKLKNVRIPSSVTSMGNHALNNYGSGLESIIVDEGNTKYDSRDNCNAIIETSTNILLYGCNNTIIPNSVTSIGYLAFLSCDEITTITIPDSVTSIGNEAFNGCDALENVYYTGTQAEWSAITIGYSNTSLTSATIHYNYSN